ncbi:hypothetical protein GCM10027343_09540 [Noviherbaspirillum agri]
MSFFHWAAVAMLSALPPGAIAGQQTLSDPVDARASGTPITYESVFKSYRAALEEQESPDKTWRSANATVGKLGGHSGHIASGESDGAAAPAEATEAASPMPVREGHGVGHADHQEEGLQQ